MIIGICGAAGAGKDTAASFLVEEHGFTVHKFAAPLYDAISALTGLTVAQLMDRDLKERPIAHFGNKSPRELLQSLGTDWGREMVAQDIWLQAAAARAVEPRCVFTDLRFPNEAEWVLSTGGQVWRVEREVPEHLACRSAHKSEAGIPDHLVSKVICNVGTIAGLRLVVSSALS